MLNHLGITSLIIALMLSRAAAAILHAVTTKKSTYSVVVSNLITRDKSGSVLTKCLYMIAWRITSQ